jgi:hypothetical protein
VVSDVQVTEAFARVEPPRSARTAEFWQGGADGRLHITRCGSCGHYLHPPRPACPVCRSRDVHAEPVSGRATVWSYTVNRYPWVPSMPVPYVVAQVELVEQAGLQLLTNIVECDIDAVHIGMKVSVCFARAGDSYIPLFRPGGW